MKGIYAYVDTMDNSVVYVGKDSHIGENRRHKQHFQQSNYDGQPINRVLQNNPNRYEYKKVFVFDDITDTELNQLEMQQIALFNPLFNFTKGGDGIKGFRHSEESRRKISESHKGKVCSVETRRKIGEANKGKSPSQETRKKISDNNGRYWLGKKLSDEHRRKMSEAQNTTGLFRVSKKKSPNCKQGFTWVYQCCGSENVYLSSINLDILEQKVKAKGLEWYKLDEVLV